MRETKVLKVRYYLTLFAEVEVEISKGENEDEAVRAFLPDVPADKFTVLTADLAEIEDEDQRKWCIKLE